jgi:hypothetical protein
MRTQLDEVVVESITSEAEAMGKALVGGRSIGDAIAAMLGVEDSPEFALMIRNALGGAMETAADRPQDEWTPERFTFEGFRMGAAIAVSTLRVTERRLQPVVNAAWEMIADSVTGTGELTDREKLTKFLGAVTAVAEMLSPMVSTDAD